MIGTATLDLGAVVVTMGNRPRELARALASLRAQEGPAIPVVVVVNGPTPDGRPLDLGDDVQVLQLPQNLGPPGARNLGAAALTTDLVAFVDDDGWWPETDTARRLVELFEQDAARAIVTMRIFDPESGTTQRRHVPRLRVGDPERSSIVTSFLEGACVARRSAWEQVGGQAEHFFFGHEATDMSWRLIDHGWSVWYAGDVTFCHPATEPGRHAVYLHNVARNRVWVARRNLPAVLVPFYLGVWIVLTHLRLRDRGALRAWWGGFAAGWTTPCGGRRPMRWRTVLALTRAGRPPVI